MQNTESPTQLLKKDLDNTKALFNKLLSKINQQNSLNFKNEYDTLHHNFLLHINASDSKIKELQSENRNVKQNYTKIENENKKINSNRNLNKEKYEKYILDLEQRLLKCEQRYSTKSNSLSENEKEKNNLILENQKLKEEINEINSENAEKSQKLLELIERLTNQINQMHENHLKDLDDYDAIIQENEKFKNQREKLKQEFNSYNEQYRDAFNEMFNIAIEQYNEEQRNKYKNSKVFKTRMSVILKPLQCYSDVKECIHEINDILKKDDAVNNQLVVDKLKKLFEDEIQKLSL